MHFIQNNWFSEHWIFLLLFLAGVLCIVAYIQNKKQLFKKSSMIFTGLFMITLFFFLLPEISASLDQGNGLLPKLAVGKSSEERISAFSKIIDFILRILKDRLAD